MTRSEVKDRQAAMFTNAMLPEICSCLRAGVNGSSDAWQQKEIGKAMRLLRDTILTWEPTTVPHSKAFDEAVFAMIVATIAEVEHYTKG